MSKELESRMSALCKAFFSISLAVPEFEVISPTPTGLNLELKRERLFINLHDIGAEENKDSIKRLEDFFWEYHRPIGSEMTVYHHEDEHNDNKAGYFAKINGRGGPTLYQSQVFETSLEAHTFGFERELFLLKKNAPREEIEQAASAWGVTITIFKLMSTLPEAHLQAIRKSIKPTDEYLLTPKGLEPDAVEEFEEVPYSRVDATGALVMASLNHHLGYEYFVDFTVERTNGLTQLTFLTRSLVGNTEHCDMKSYLAMIETPEDGWFQSIADGYKPFPCTGALHPDTGEGYLSVLLPISMSGWNGACKNSFFSYFEHVAAFELLNNHALTLVRGVDEVSLNDVVVYLGLDKVQKGYTR